MSHHGHNNQKPAVAVAVALAVAVAVADTVVSKIVENVVGPGDAAAAASGMGAHARFSKL